jgi:hypothetical protein
VIAMAQWRKTVPISTGLANAATRYLPKVISPKGHALADYAVVGSFLLMGALFWRRNKPASIGALVCGGTGLANNLLTDYPGGISKAISFPVHGKIDVGLAGMTALMPEFMAFNHEPQKKFFIAQAALMTAVANLTDFSRYRVRAYAARRHKNAA